MGLDFVEHGADFEEAIAATGYGKFHYLLLAMCGLIYVNTAMGLTLISFVLPSAQCDFQMASKDKGLLSAIPLLGMVIGSYFWGCLADTKGRRVVLIATLLIDAMCGFASSVAQFFELFMTFRFFNGFALSGAVGICFPYLGEFQPTKYREKILCWMEIFWTVGIIILPLIAWLIIPISNIRFSNQYFTFDSWNLFILVCSVPNLLLASWLFTFPESPKFMMECGDYDDALQVLKKIYHRNTGDSEDNYPIKSLQEKPTTVSNISHNNKSVRNLSMRKSTDVIRLFSEIWEQTKALCKPPHRKYAVLICLIQFGLYTSYYTLVIWFPELLNRFEEYEEMYPGQPASVCDVATIVVDSDGDDIFCGEPIQNSVYLHTIIIGLACIPTSLWLPLCVHRLGAKFFLISSLVIAGGVNIGFYFVQNSTQNLILSALFEAFTSVAVISIFCMLVDLFPTNLRARAAALSLTFGRGGGLIGNLVFGYLVDLNCVVPIVLFSAMLLFSGVLCLFLPKTGNVALN